MSVFELHGWLVIDGDSGSRWRACDRIAAFPEAPDVRVDVGEVGGVGGRLRLTVTARGERCSPAASEALALLRRTAREAAGSYGVVHVVDDDDAEHPGVFRTLVLEGGHEREDAGPFAGSRTSVERSG